MEEIPPLSPGHQTFLPFFTPSLSSSAQDFLCCFAKVLGWREAVQSVNGSVIMTIASSFGISAALTQTGAVISALHWMFFFCNCRGLLLYTHFNYSRTHAPFFIRSTDLFMETRHNQSEQASNHPQEASTIAIFQINEMPRRMLWQMHCSQLVCVSVPLVCFACSTLEQPC